MFPRRAVRKKSGGGNYDLGKGSGSENGEEQQIRDLHESRSDL